MRKKIWPAGEVGIKIDQYIKETRGRGLPQKFPRGKIGWVFAAGGWGGETKRGRQSGREIQKVPRKNEESTVPKSP